MKKYIFIVPILLLFTSFLTGQSIRKSFTELTDTEKAELQNAIYGVRDLNNDGIISNDINSPDADDLLLDLAKFHKDFFRYYDDPLTEEIDESLDDSLLDIHFNLPNQINIQIFFSWHRYQMFEMEQALQTINPKISLAYWDSSVVQDSLTLANTLFGPELLGPFNTDWSLERDLFHNGYILPTPAQVTSVHNLPDFALSTENSFSNSVERAPVHVGAHVWTGGAMPTPASPADPVFYFHHSWIDKLWVDWEVDNPGASSFIIQSMIRFDGTYSFNGNTLPLVNPNNIINTRSLGVFYAENGLVELDSYSVSNTHHPIENFYYQYTIEVGNDFTIPNSTNCEIESVNEIVLKPGFFAESGAIFTAKIDTDNDITTLTRSDITQNRYNPIDFGSDIDNNAYEQQKILGFEEFNTLKTQLYPNPFRNKFTLNFDQIVKSCSVEIYDINGSQVYSKNFTNKSNLVIDNLDHLSTGVYILNVVSDNDLILNTRIIKK